MASSTAAGFWAEAPLSRYTRGFPLISWVRIGKSRRMASASNALVLVLFAMDRSVMPSGLLEGLLEEIIQPHLGGFPHGHYRNLIDQFIDEGHGQKYIGLTATNATRHQVEHGGLVQLADGGPVGALYVVRVDFQLRLGVDLSAVVEQQVLVIHIRAGFLRVLVDMNAPVEDGVRLVGSDVPVGLFAGAVSSHMINGGVVVVVLLVLGNDHAIELGFCAFAFQAYLQVVPAQGAAKTDAVAFKS